LLRFGEERLGEEVLVERLADLYYLQWFVSLARTLAVEEARVFDAAVEAV